MSSFKKFAKAGHIFQLSFSPAIKYKLAPVAGTEETFTLMQGALKVAIATFTYKHLHLTIHHGGLRFTKEIPLSEITFLP